MNKIKFSRSEIADSDFHFNLKDACQTSGPWAAFGPFILLRETFQVKARQAQTLQFINRNVQ